MYCLLKKQTRRLERASERMSPVQKQQLTEWSVDKDYTFDKSPFLRFKLLPEPRMSYHQQVLAYRIKYGLGLGPNGEDAGRCDRCGKESRGRQAAEKHAATCKVQGFPIIAHNEISDLFANMYRKVGTQVSTEDPHVISDVNKITDNGPLSRRKPFDFWAHGAANTAADVCIVSQNTAVRRAEKLKIRKYIPMESCPKLSDVSVVPSNNLLHIPGTPDGVRWAPLVISRHGKWGVYATILVQKLGYEIAKVYRRSQIACQRWIFTHVNAVLMHTFVCSVERAVLFQGHVPYQNG